MSGPDASASAPAPAPAPGTPAVGTTGAGTAPEPVIVVVAPGFPGTTAQAQPTMDLFSRALAGVMERPPATLSTAYFESETGGEAALARPAVRYALVPLPYYLKHAERLSLTPRLLVDEGGGTTQSWSLAAPRGQVGDAAALAGWEVVGTPGYAPAFVRMTLAGWGALPSDTRITASAGILSALRRVAGGGKVAVLLDRAQAAALQTLPFAADLEIVATSPPFPSTLFCTVGPARDHEADPVVTALAHLHENNQGAAALAAMRMTRFVALAPETIPPLRAAYAAALAHP